jgi:hypothetical protein
MDILGKAQRIEVNTIPEPVQSVPTDIPPVIEGASGLVES